MFKIALILLNHVIYNTAALHMPDTSRYTQSVTKIPYSPKDEHQKCVWIMQHFIIHKTVHRFLFFFVLQWKITCDGVENLPLLLQFYYKLVIHQTVCYSSS